MEDDLNTEDILFYLIIGKLKLSMFNLYPNIFFRLSNLL